MFVAPVLFVIHAALTGLSLFIAAIFHWTAGFSFSAGLIDFVLSLVNPVSNKPWMLLVQGIIFFILYYAIFRFVIHVFNLNTIGRGITNLRIQRQTLRLKIILLHIQNLKANIIIQPHKF